MGKEGIHFILTGGTMDSHYDGTKDTVVPNKESVIPNYINGLKLYSKVKFTQICMKDSRDITKFDQKKILELIEKSSENKFIITHGTYTMSDTARYIKANLKRKDIRIIFTGSFIPMTGFMNSDGLFNLGFCCSEIQKMDAGIIICMNGKTFSADEATKIITEGKFTSIFSK